MIIEKLTGYFQQSNNLKTPAEVQLKDLEKFLKWIAELGLNATSQARIISGIRAFYKYCF